MPNPLKIEKRILLFNSFQKSFITKQLKEQLHLKVLKTEQMFIKIFASGEPTLQNLEVFEVKMTNVENLNYNIINVLAVPLICTPLFPVDTERKLNVHKTFRRCPAHLLNVLCTFNLRSVSTGVFSYWI